MAIPIAYNLRNLVVRKTTTLMTALGIALTVAVLLAIMALLNGLRGAFRTTGNPLHVLVLRKGSDSELTSGVDRLAYQAMKFKAGVARGVGSRRNHGCGKVGPQQRDLLRPESDRSGFRANRGLQLHSDASERSGHGGGAGQRSE